MKRLWIAMSEKKLWDLKVVMLVRLVKRGFLVEVWLKMGVKIKNGGVKIS